MHPTIVHTIAHERHNDLLREAANRRRVVAARRAGRATPARYGTAVLRLIEQARSVHRPVVTGRSCVDAGHLASEFCVSRPL